MKKNVVEDCIVLNINQLNWKGILAGASSSRWTITWSNGSSIGLFTMPDDEKELCLTLEYTWKDEHVTYVVPLTSTPCHFGGKRYWFICQGKSEKGVVCRRRVGSLYKPYYSRYFLCRHCFDLSYRSRQEWKSRTEVGLLFEAFELCSKLEKYEKGEQPPKRLEKKVMKLFEAFRRKGMIR